MSAARTKTVLVGCALALATSAAAGTAALVLPEEANAAYPGSNGRLAFCFGSSGGSIGSVSPGGFGSRQEVPNGGGEYTCDPAYSPDGTKLAFTSDHDGFLGLYVKDLGSGQVTQLTDDEEGLPERRPSWSPDGKKLVFDDQNDLWVMDAADGSNRTHLTDTAAVTEWQAAWSPKGTKIAFQSEDDIWVMDANGSNRKNLTRTPDLEDSFASWSPSGRKIAWGRESIPNSSATKDVWKMNADGSSKKRLTYFAGFEGDPAWSPNGKKIAFVRDAQGDTDIWKIDASDGSNKTPVTDNDFDESSLDWQPKLAR